MDTSVFQVLSVVVPFCWRH